MFFVISFPVPPLSYLTASYSLTYVHQDLKDKNFNMSLFMTHAEKAVDTASSFRLKVLTSAFTTFCSFCLFGWLF